MPLCQHGELTCPTFGRADDLRPTWLSLADYQLFALDYSLSRLLPAALFREREQGRHLPLCVRLKAGTIGYLFSFEQHNNYGNLPLARGAEWERWLSVSRWTKGRDVF